MHSEYRFKGVQFSDERTQLLSATSCYNSNRGTTCGTLFKADNCQVDELSAYVDHTIPIGNAHLTAGIGKISDSGFRTTEWYATFSKDNTSLNVVHDFDQGKGWVADLSQNLQLGGLDMKLTGGYNDGYWASNEGLWASAKASKSFTTAIGTITPYVEGTVGKGSEGVDTITGITLNYEL